MFAEAGCTGSDTWIRWFGRVSEYFWRLHFPVTEVIFKPQRKKTWRPSSGTLCRLFQRWWPNTAFWSLSTVLSGDLWWPTVWRAALQRVPLHCESITPRHSASDAVCCCCFETRTSFYCLCKDERKNFLHHRLINELASSDPDVIDPCSPLSLNPWNTAGRNRAGKWRLSTSTLCF